MRWKNRLILLFSRTSRTRTIVPDGMPGEELRMIYQGPPLVADARASASRDALEAHPEALADRRLIVLDAAWTPIHSGPRLRAHYDVPEGWSGALLIGLDGTEKARVEGVVDPEAWFAQIDAMPMRAAELQARQADDPDAD